MWAVLAVVDPEPRSNAKVIFAISKPIILPIVDYFDDLRKICRLWLRELADAGFKGE